MILPVYAYGHSILKKKCTPIDIENLDLKDLIANMYDTMYHCKGVGLAAPQIGMDKRLFIIDSSKLNDDDERKDKSEDGIKEVFINAEMMEEFGGLTSYEEGCLSIPGVYANIDRERKIKIKYYNANLELQEKEFAGFTARIIQHEYDHIEGILFVEKMKPIKKQLMKRKLDDIKKGNISPKFKMIFA